MTLRWIAGALPIAAALAIMATMAAAQDAPKDTPAAPDPGGKATVSGLIDLYYQYDFNHPPRSSTVAGRAFDVRNDEFALSLVEVNAVRTPGKGLPVGITLTGTLGKTADIVHATEPGSKTVRFLQQAFVTYTTETRTPVTLDFGKFVTWLGYEVIESSSNDNYSRSYLFNYAIPFYHLGVRATAPVSRQATLGFYLVNGWNDVEDDNGGKSYGASLALTPTKGLTATLNYIGGDEFTGAGLPRNLDVQLGDLILVWNAGSRLKLAANADYASAAKPAAQGGHWSGEAVYARYQLTPANAVALRAEHFEDSDGLRTGTGQDLNEVTATLEHTFRGSVITRLEYRHDHAGSAFFPTRTGASRSQDTLTLSGVVKF